MVTIGSDSFILTKTNTDKTLNVQDPKGREFRLTITISWEEYRQPGQAPGSLWFHSTLGKQTPALLSISSSFQIVPNVTTPLLIVSHGAVYIHYTGDASAHVWLSYYAEFVD